MQPERLGSQRLATEIFKHAAVVMLYRTLKFLERPTPKARVPIPPKPA